MPKRSGSNKLKKSRSSGPRRPKSASPDNATAARRSSTAPSSSRDLRDDETRPEKRSNIVKESVSEPPPAPAAPTSAPARLWQRFQLLPETTRYGIYFAVAMAFALVLYFAFSGTGASTPSSTPAGSSSVQLTPPIKIDWTSQPGVASAPVRAPVSAPVPSASTIPSAGIAPAVRSAAATAAPPPAPVEPKKTAAPAAEPVPAPQPVQPAPAPPPAAKGTDNPY